MEVRRVLRHHVFEQLVYGVGRPHNSNESSAGHTASFTRFTARFSKGSNHPIEGHPRWVISPMPVQPLRSSIPQGRRPKMHNKLRKRLAGEESGFTLIE